MMRQLALTGVCWLMSSAAYAQPQKSATWHAEGQQGAVAAGGRAAADAGVEILKSGGNAVDAAVATMLVLTVTDPGNFCFGGEVPIIIYDAKRDVVEVLSGQGVAPRLATLAHFEKQGGIPSGGPQSAAVPGALDVFLVALQRHGTRRLADVAAPMMRLLKNHTGGWQADLASTMRRLIEAEACSPADRRRGLRLAADYFYRGPVARELDAWSRANGGLIRYTDLATHVTRIEEPVAVEYRGHTVYKCGAWTQGPYLLQTLRLLEDYDLREMGHNGADYVHVVTEAMKLALADRDTYYADPLFVDVPLKTLLSTAYADLRRPLIDPMRASREHRPGDPDGGKALRDPTDRPMGKTAPASDTTTCVVADAAGNVVAATPSGWGGVLAGETGVQLGSRLKSLNAWRGHPNCIEPGKRPRITLTPTIVFREGKPVLAVSVAGGDWQDQVTLQMLLNCLAFGMTPAESVIAPRFGTGHLVGSFNQPPPRLASLMAYEDVGEATLAELKSRGHRIRIVKPPFWHPCVLAIDPETGRKRAAGDPNARRHAAAY